MVSADPQAISAVLTASSTATTTTHHPGLAAAADRPADWTDGWFYYLVPDISDEVARGITKARAWPAFNAVFRHLRRCHRLAERDGRQGDAAATRRAAACQAGVLDDEGIKGLARSVGLTPKAMSRQITALQALGILAAFRPPASMTRDPDTGRIIRRPCKAGRVEAAKIILTLGDDHRRPANRQGFNRPLPTSRRTKAAKAGREPLGVVPTPTHEILRGRSDTTSIPPSGIPLPTPPAADEGGRRVEDDRQRPDGRRGGLTAAGQEGGRRDGSDAKRRHSVTGEATPPPPAEAEAEGSHLTAEDTAMAGRLDTPDRSDRTEAGPSVVRPSGQGGGRPPADNPADGSGMDRSLGSWVAEAQRLRAERAGTVSPATKAADDLRRSLDELPDDSRQRAAGLGRIIEAADDEAGRLAEIIKRRQEADEAATKVEAKAKADGHREAWHRRRRPKAVA